MNRIICVSVFALLCSSCMATEQRTTMVQRIGMDTQIMRESCIEYYTKRALEQYNASDLFPFPPLLHLLPEDEIEKYLNRVTEEDILAIRKKLLRLSISEIPSKCDADLDTYIKDSGKKS